MDLAKWFLKTYENFRRPAGTRLYSSLFPALKRRAIFSRPSGAAPFVTASSAPILGPPPKTALLWLLSVKSRGHVSHLSFFP